MNNFYAITVAFARSAQFARSIVEYRKTRSLKPDRHIVVQAHYPIDTERNNKEIEILCKSFADLELIDPGSDIGSAQSQQFALEYLKAGDSDFWTNIDNDSACKDRGWDLAARKVLEGDINCVVVSCDSPMVREFFQSRNQPVVSDTINGVNIFKAHRPTPFNLSVFRQSFIKEIGGIRQFFPCWGELEGLIWQEATKRNKYHCYLSDYFEDESGKFFHPKSNAEWKDRHARTTGSTQFLGKYSEYLAYFHPELAKMKL